MLLDLYKQVTDRWRISSKKCQECHDAKYGGSVIANLVDIILAVEKYDCSV